MKGKHYNTHYNMPRRHKKGLALDCTNPFPLFMCGFTAKTDVYPVETPPTKTKND